MLIWNSFKDDWTRNVLILKRRLIHQLSQFEYGLSFNFIHLQEFGFTKKHKVYWVYLFTKYLKLLFNLTIYNNGSLPVTYRQKNMKQLANLWEITRRPRTVIGTCYCIILDNRIVLKRLVSCIIISSLAWGRMLWGKLVTRLTKCWEWIMRCVEEGFPWLGFLPSLREKEQKDNPKKVYSFL